MVLQALALPLGGQVIMAAGGKSEKQGLFDWLNKALEKETLSETDPILQKVEGKSAPPPSGKKGAASAPKRRVGSEESEQ
ncbi:hypothetical protein R1flu_029315 [Riccia fluitans]|uniref:Uncharacterized protein n=1 Tax=Riccia fluitans TaxID=41844 RepID=A0ABD1XP64_9MARC